MNWLHLRQTPSVRNTRDSGGPRLERVPGRSEQGKPWPGPPTWAAFISMDRPLGLADDYVTTKLPLQSPKKRRWEGHGAVLPCRLKGPALRSVACLPTHPVLFIAPSQRIYIIQRDSSPRIYMGICMCGGESERGPPCGSAAYIRGYVGLYAWWRERGRGRGGGEEGGERNNPSSKPLDKHSTPIDRH